MSRLVVGLSVLIILSGWVGAVARAGGYGFDVVLPPDRYAEQLAEGGLDGRAGSWMRVRGLVDHHRVKASDTRTVETERAGLLALRERGIKTAVFLRWNGDSWKNGVRPGWGHRMPLDLREAFERGKWLGVTYGDLVDVWEIDNEPDIDFGPDNPETYAAFLKTVYLGLKAGVAEGLTAKDGIMYGLTAKDAKGREVASGGGVVAHGTHGLHGRRAEQRTWDGVLTTKNTNGGGDDIGGAEGVTAKTREEAEAIILSSRSEPSELGAYLRHPVRQPHPGFQGLGRGRNQGADSLSARSERQVGRVIMAPLALPPGPYLERLWANGIASYTDGFNFHYYGYAEDFTGVYRQFEDAVTRLSAEGEGLTAKDAKIREAANRGGGVAHGTHGLRGRSSELRSGWGADSDSNLVADSRASKRTRTMEAEPAFSRGSLATNRSKHWHVFITEYGYGLLDADSRNSVEGRVRQWAWFADVVNQVRALRIEAPMAFLWNPYYEADLNEFGLTQVVPAEVSSEGREVVGRKLAGAESDGRTGTSKRTRTMGADGGHSGSVNLSRSRSPGVDSPKPSELTLRAAKGVEGLVFSPEDFGARREQLWMRRIGQRVGEWYASPALAYLWDYAERKPYRPRAWSVRAAPASPVVIDFLAGQDMVQVKSFGGYVLAGAPVEWSPRPVRTGRAWLVVYNLGTEPVSGRVEIETPSPLRGAWDGLLTLAPGERLEVPVELGISGERWVAQGLRARFVSEDRAAAPALFSTELYPAPYGMTETRVADFRFGSDAGRHAGVGSRLVATGESRLQRDGRWWVTDGVRVEETAEGVWRFHIDHLPVEALRPAIVELPLPKGFSFERGTLFSLERRKVAAGEDVKLEGVTAKGAKEREGAEADVRTREGSVSAPTPAQLTSRAGRAGDMMDVYFRTENGNLYQTWPRLRVSGDWTRYLESAENFTMGFFGRAELPWRFSENTPVALVFFLRPSELPAVFEVRNAEIVRLAE